MRWTARSEPLARVAVAPWSWGVCDEPGWGVQLMADRVRAEARALGAHAIEAGPPGFLRRSRGLRVPAGFVSAPIHRSSLPLVDRYAGYLASLRTELLVVAPAGDRRGYEGHPTLDARGWAELFDAIGGMTAIAHRHGLQLAVHPHFGTLLETQPQLERFLVGCEAGLCLDVGDLVLGGIDPVELVDLAPRRIRHVHLKDVDGGFAAALRRHRHGYWEAVFKGLFPPLGEGSAPVAEVIGALRRHGYAGWLTIEQETVLPAEPPAGEGPCAAVGRSLRYLAEVLAG